MGLGIWVEHGLLAVHEGQELFTEDLWKFASAVVWVANAGGLASHRALRLQIELTQRWHVRAERIRLARWANLCDRANAGDRETDLGAIRKEGREMAVVAGRADRGPVTAVDAWAGAVLAACEDVIAPGAVPLNRYAAETFVWRVLQTATSYSTGTWPEKMSGHAIPDETINAATRYLASQWKDIAAVQLVSNAPRWDNCLVAPDSVWERRYDETFWAVDICQLVGEAFVPGFRAVAPRLRTEQQARDPGFSGRRNESADHIWAASFAQQSARNSQPTVNRYNKQLEEFRRGYGSPDAPPW